MAQELTKQEQIFFNRVALAIVEAGGEVTPASIEAGARQVLARDAKLVEFVLGPAREQVVAELGAQVYQALRSTVAA